MITPMDLRTKTFKKVTVGGYDRKEIDEYLEVLTEDYEKVYKQSIENADKINTLTKLLDSYKAMEDNIKDSIVVAQSTAEELAKTSREKAELVLEDARIKAEKIIAEANEKTKEAERQFSELKTAMEMYKSSAKGMLEAQLEVIAKFKTE